MRQSLVFAVLIVLVLGLNLPLTALAKSSVPQQIPPPPPGCYPVHCGLEVDIVDVKILAGTAAPPATAFVVKFIQAVPVGTAFVVKFHVIYPDGTPVTLAPPTVSFGFSNSSGMFKTSLNTPVVPTPGERGNYTFNSVVTADFPIGQVDVNVLADSCHDAYANSGPPSNRDSAITINPFDYSIVEIGLPPKPPQPNYTVPTIIAALLVIALLLFAMRRRGKKQKKT